MRGVHRCGHELNEAYSSPTPADGSGRQPPVPAGTLNGVQNPVVIRLKPYKSDP
jgi:hypothetical protein